jgi:UV DNA damage endonuclease
MTNIGYACINLSLGKNVTTNRTMIKKTFQQKGVDYVSEIVLQNVSDLERIIGDKVSWKTLLSN